MNKLQIHARLIEKGSNFRRFALSHGYEPRTVRQAVDRYVGKDRLPRGQITLNILRDISRLIEAEIIPGLFSATAASPLTQANRLAK